MDRAVDFELLVHDAHYPAVIDRVLAAKRSVWIATANLKELMVEDRRLLPGRARGAVRSPPVRPAGNGRAAAGGMGAMITRGSSLNSCPGREALHHGNTPRPFSRTTSV